MVGWGNKFFSESSQARPFFQDGNHKVWLGGIIKGKGTPPPRMERVEAVELRAVSQNIPRKFASTKGGKGNAPKKEFLESIQHSCLQQDKSDCEHSEVGKKLQQEVECISPKTTKIPRFLDLFSGTGSVARILEGRGYEVTTVDISSNFEPNILTDLLQWNFQEAFPKGHFDVIACSPHSLNIVVQ